MTTKEILTITAGKLFAEFGYEAVSTRAIAEKAGVKLSAIHYHFGTKENLYIKAFELAKTRGMAVRFKDVINENPALLKSEAGQAEIIRNTVYRRFYDYFREDREHWETQLFLREIANPSSVLPRIAEELFKPENDGSIDFYKTVKPNGTTKEAIAWSDMLFAQTVFYITAREAIEIVRGKDSLDNEFFQATARVLSRAMILALNLPLPEDLQD